jgi:DnaJ domain
MIKRIIFALACAILSWTAVAAFCPLQVSKIRSPINVVQWPMARRATFLLAAAGRGMSSSKTTSKSKAAMGEKKNGMASPKAKSDKSAPFNVNASLQRLEKKYDELTKANARTLQKDDDDDDEKDSEESTTKDAAPEEDAIVTTEYVIAVRADGHVGDWVPVAQFCLARNAIQASRSDGVADPLIQAAISHHCRELCHVASLGSRVFHSVPRNLMQYSVETLDSFHKHVYETAIQGKNEDESNSNVMTKEEARSVLDLVNGDGEDKAAIKRSYRTLSFQWHPDRFVGTDRSPEEIEAANERYAKIKLAYDTLNSGVRDEGTSWYQSLGGKARTDFLGPLQLLGLDVAKVTFEGSGAECAICSMSPSIVQTFVARSQQ